MTVVFEDPNRPTEEAIDRVKNGYQSCGVYVYFEIQSTLHNNSNQWKWGSMTLTLPVAPRRMFQSAA
jgi:hypothetical protein